MINLDAILEELDRSGSIINEWLIVSTDSLGMQALNTHWNNRKKLVMVIAPDESIDIQDALITILEHEGVPHSKCIWLVGGSSRPVIEDGIGHIVDLNELPYIVGDFSPLAKHLNSIANQIQLQA